MSENFEAEESRLFSPLKINSVWVKNRLMRSAMAEAMADQDGFITNDLLNFYKIAAEGGVGLIITGAVSVHPKGKFFNQQIVVHNDQYIPGLKKLSDTIHRYGDGVKVWLQLHCGAVQHWEDSSGHRNPGLDVDNLGERDIYTIINAFGDAALRAKKAGLDGVQIHGAHRYLVAQFLSPATNSRSDKWGGSPEDRMRLVLEIYSNIREKVGPEFPVGIKMNTADYLHGGNWIDDTAVYAKHFSRAGFDLIEMSGGLFYITELREELRKKVGAREAYFRDAIPKFKEAVAEHTVLAIAGGIRTPDVMENILNEGVDLVSLARPFLAEPNLPNRIIEGDIRPSKCVSTYSLCNLCRTKVLRGSVTCVNYFPGDCVHHCPVGQDVPNIHKLLVQNRYEEALSLIKKDNPLANVLSRVCHSPCERICRGEDGEPLAIRQLKKHVTNYGLQNNLCMEAAQKVLQDGEKVAIVGSGPAGLTCAYFLAQMGYNPTIIEKEDYIGGKLNYIPSYRLPQSFIDADIKYIISCGVEIRNNTTLGKDISIQELFDQQFKAVFLATGASVPNHLNIEGERCEGVYNGLEFLKRAEQGNMPSIGEKVALIGGGNAAVDSSRSALRLGAQEVVIYYRRNHLEMPAIKGEVRQALEEGVKIEDQTAPVKIKEKNNKLEVTFCKTRMESKNGNVDSQVVPVTGSEFIKVFDRVIIATGQSSNLNIIDQKLELSYITWGNPDLKHYPLLTNIPGVFAGGDLTSEAGTVVEAAGVGKKAAYYIDDYLQGRSIESEKESDYYIRVTREDAFRDPGEVIDWENPRRVKIPLDSIKKRISNFNEIEGNLESSEAVLEAKRCLKYDLDLIEKTQAKMARMSKDTFILEPKD